VAVLLLAAGAGLVAAMFKWTDGAKKDNVQAQQLRAEAIGKLSRAQEEEKEISLNIIQYRALADKGVIGEERRLDWIERIAAIKTTHRLYDIHYEIAEQRRLDNPASETELMMSKMVLTMPLLDEEDLFGLLRDMRAANRDYFQVKSCSITRAAVLTDRRVLAPTLNATCELDFYTIREKTAVKVAGS
jgi:hypothetical protein